MAVVALGGSTAWWTHAAADRRAVAAAAVAGYVASHPGARVGAVDRQDDQDGCALVSVLVPSDPDGTVHLVARRQAGRWVYLGRSTVDLDASPLPEVCRPGSDLLGDR